MKLTISHRTVYRYDAPQKSVLQSQRLFPSVFDGQSVVEWSVKTENGIDGSDFRDGAGNQTRTVRVQGPVEEVVTVVEGILETTDQAGVLRGHREKVPPLAYVDSTRMTRADVALTELAEAAMAEAAADGPLAQAHAMSRAVTKAIVYTPKSTGSDTTAAEALASGKGVCQDQTHALISMARSQGIPARYVTGYLFAGGDPLAETMAQASHAWAEIYVEGLGWVGFDPANESCPDERYVRLCSGADALDAAPIRGISSGTGEQSLDVTVAVQAVQQ